MLRPIQPYHFQADLIWCDSTFKCLMANYCMRWRGSLKGPHRMGDGRNSLKNHIAALFNDDPRMSLISAVSILLDSSFKTQERQAVLYITTRRRMVHGSLKSYGNTESSSIGAERSRIPLPVR